MLRIIVKVTQVDMNGFTGRDDHPKPEHEGLRGVVTNMDIMPDDEMETPEELAPWCLRKGVQSLYCVLENGDTVELLPREVELVSCELV